MKREIIFRGKDANDDDWYWNCDFSMIPDYWKSKYQKKIKI